MPDNREKIGRATQTSNMGDREGAYEVDNERVGALGVTARATPLGAALTRWIGGMSMLAYIEAVRLLARSIKHRFGIDADLACKIALQACREWGDWACIECNGRGELISGEGVRFVCTSCGGTKIRRYGDAARADSLGMSIEAYRAQATRLAWALEQLRREDRCARYSNARQLGPDEGTT
jgi:hypothetical protein